MASDATRMIWMQKQKRISSIWEFRIAIEAMFNLELADASSVKPIKADLCRIGKRQPASLWHPQGSFTQCRFHSHRNLRLIRPSTSPPASRALSTHARSLRPNPWWNCLLYTSDAADEE